MLPDASIVARPLPHHQSSSPFSPDIHRPGSEQNINSAVNPTGPRVGASPAAVSHSRDGSLNRGRVPGPAQGNAVPAPALHRAASARRAAAPDSFSGRATPQLDTALQRRASNNYGHHRQTSVINGRQHSRNPSFNTPTTSSPLSPESIHNAGHRNATTMRRVQAIATADASPSVGSPFTPDSAHSQHPSIDSALGLDSSPLDHAQTYTRKRTGTSRNRRGHAYASSVTGRDGEVRTPGEYALHHLFHSFVLRADQKINHCLTILESAAVPVEDTCGRGADASFDQLIAALGHIARQEPKPLVDSLMLWRKAKGDAAASFKKQMQQQQQQQPTPPQQQQQQHRLQSSGSNLPSALPRRHTEPVGQDVGSPQAFPGSHTAPPDEPSGEYVQADRKATISVYILCRVLVEIFEQSSLASITPELAIKLEEIVFSQLRDVEPAQIVHSTIRLANWRMYGELLGQMSRIDFMHVTQRFVSQLESWQAEIARSSATVGARDLESRVELMLYSMRNLHVLITQANIGPVCDFFKALANLFYDSHGPTIKQGYCQTFEKLLVQVANEPQLLQNLPRFREMSDTITSRLAQMLSKVRHWNSALPLSTLLLCLSPIDVFSSQWLTTLTNLAQKLKDRNTRTPAMRAICQLLWTYLHRAHDQLAVKIRKVEDVVKLVFPPGKKTHVSSESSMSEALVYFVRIVGYTFPEMCFRNIIFPLINSDLFTSARELRVEQMEPEKMVVGIRSFLALISDLEKEDKTRPAFPTFNAVPPLPDGMPMSPNPSKSFLGTELTLPSARKPEPISTVPVNVAGLDDQSKHRYLQFCEILGKIAILCDQTFGSSAALNEKLAISPNVFSPKTPLAEAFTLVKREDGLLTDQKQPYYDLLHVAIQALPRCFSNHVPLNNLINLLCTGSAHVQPQIAATAAQSLKAVAQQNYAQAVATAFPRFIFNYDSQYSTMSDEGRLGPAHIESTLTLYLELLQVWSEQLRQKTKSTIGDPRDRTGSNTSRAVQMEMTNAVSLVDEMEAYGLFFLCSQSRRVRAFAIKVLRLVVQFDEILGKQDSARVISILENKSTDILDLDTNALSAAERARLQKDKRGLRPQDTLIEICSSEVTYDATLWFKGFPNLVRHVYDMCPNAVALCRGIVCDRLALMQGDVEKLASAYGLSQDFRLLGRSASTPAEVLFDQWKLYLVFACVTLNSTGAQSQSQLANAAHGRKTSRTAERMQEKLGSARALFSAVIPMLGVGPDAIRSAVVVALGSINPKLYRTLLESLQYAVITCNDEAKARLGSHQRTPSSPQRTQMTERMRTEVTQIYKLTSSFLRHEDLLEDEWVLNNLVNYTRDLRLFLSDAEIQTDWHFLKLRFHYCGLMEEVYTNVSRSTTPGRWMPFESRKSAFTLMEEWCGFVPDQGLQGRSVEAAMQADFSTGVHVNAATEKDKSSLRVAALSAMAALCAGPISVVTESNTLLQFNIPRMLSWIDAVFATSNDKMHAIGQRALQALLVHNADHPQIVEHAIQQCYGAKSSTTLESYFSVVTDVLIERPDYPIPITRVLATVIFTLGDENREIRMKSTKLLRILDARQQKRSNLQEFDISISDKTRAVYKLAQFEYSRRLAHAHPELAFAIFSEFAFQFRRVHTDHQRNMVAAVLPWLQTLELQVDPSTAGPTAASYMLLSNMLEITVRFSGTLHNEVQALWQALATGPHAGNVQLVLDFIISLSVDRREQNFVEYSKQIVVYLSATPAGSKLMDFLLMQLVPKNMINEKKGSSPAPPDMSGLPYAADLSTVLPLTGKQAGLSLGQVSLILLVDLMVSPVSLMKDEAIKLVHAVIILWDHYTSAVQEQAREMLVHLIHELVTTKVDDLILKEKQQHIEETVEAIRRNESLVTWTYDDHTGKEEIEQIGNRVPPSMAYLTAQIVDVFKLAFDNFSNLWAKEALHWASICPVRHLACRSSQVFRCISNTIDSKMLADMLARLSNTIADEQSDYQTFSLEILTTLKVLIGELDSKSITKHPQLFWTTSACLDTIHEREFFESLGMLEKLLDRLDLADPLVTDLMLKSKPAKWEGSFTGLQPLVYKGLKSADCLERSLNVLHKFAALPDNALVGTRDRLLYNVLAHLPSFLHGFEFGSGSSEIIAHAQRLADSTQKEGHMTLSLCLHKFSTKGYLSGRQFLVETIGSIKASFLPQYDSHSLIFLIGLLTNQTGWFRIKIMDILCELIPHINMRDSAITNHGPDLISPLLRLLQTEHCVQALQVLDHIMEVSSTPLDKHHLRMSMASGSARAIRKEYERTQSLYGIPMPSGWSIPMPAVHSNLTRNNVHAVFYTCGDSDTKEQPAATPEIDFSPDDGYVDSYFPSQGRSDTMRTIDAVVDTNMGDIVSNLESLDDFFDDVDNVPTPTVSQQDQMPQYFTSTIHENGTNMYDEHTAPILSRSLARTPSSLSFQNGFAESRPSTSHRNQQSSSSASGWSSLQTSISSIDELGGPGPSMADTAKKPPPPAAVPGAPVRPGLHARSITSPANQFPASHPTTTITGVVVPALPTLGPTQADHMGFQNDDGSLSDSENTPFPALSLTTSNPGSRNATSPGIYVLGGQAPPVEAGGGFNIRRGFRRLTGGKSESAKEREKARLRGLSGSQPHPGQPALSPKVPRVPLEYLNQNMHSGGGGVPSAAVTPTQTGMPVSANMNAASSPAPPMSSEL